MSQALLAIQNILQNSNIFDRSRKTVVFTPFCDKKVTQFSDFPPTSASYLNTHLKSTLWRFAEFYYNGGLQRPYTDTCTILQK